MLLACRYSVSRRQVIVLLLLSCMSYHSVFVCLQERYRRQHGINILDADKFALFSGISVEEMDRSIIKSIAYLVSHVFEFYGPQVSICARDNQWYCTLNHEEFL